MLEIKHLILRCPTWSVECAVSEFLTGKTVLAFFVGAFTSTCTKEMCTFRDSMARLVDLKAQIVGMAVTDPFSNKEFAEKNRLTFPILSDYKRDAIRAYGIELLNFSGLPGYTTAKRAIFILDIAGIVRYVWITNDPAVEPNYDEIEAFLAKM